MRANCSSSATATPSPLVLDGSEFQQTQVFALFPMPVGFLPDVDGWPVRNDVRPLQQFASIAVARLSVRPKDLRFWVVLVRIQKHEEILRKYPATVVLIREFVDGRLMIMNVDALRMHPLIAFG